MSYVGELTNTNPIEIDSPTVKVLEESKQSS